jgi:hypothetical protein
LEEEKRKKAQVLMSGPPRHSFFTGTFTRRWKVSGRPHAVTLQARKSQVMTENTLKTSSSQAIPRKPENPNL